MGKGIEALKLIQEKMGNTSLSVDENRYIKVFFELMKNIDSTLHYEGIEYSIGNLERYRKLTKYIFWCIHDSLYYNINHALKSLEKSKLKIETETKLLECIDD